MTEPTTATTEPTTEPTTTEPTTATTEPTTTSTTTTEPNPTETVEFWRDMAREQEKRAKDNVGKAKEYDKLVAASQTETERAQAAAEAAEQRAADMQGRIVAAEIKAALTGVVPDPAAVVGDLNLAKFVTDDGNVDAEAVTALRERYEKLAPAGDGPRTPAPTPGQGANTTPRAGQITREALDTMSQTQIHEARKAGLLNDILGIQS